MEGKTPWGRMDVRNREFYFVPKFSMNSLPYAVDGLFVQSDLSVMCKYSMADKKWVVARIDDEDGETVWLDDPTLMLLTLQARVRINAAFGYISKRVESN
tara:strand:- start:689 stop:988 length:300 start_codon:yes stop_codon:yes gene_type:complete